MKKFLTTGLVLILFATQLFSFQKNNEKVVEVEQERFPDADFAILEADDPNGELIFITVNKGYKDYKFKKDYPWFLLVQIQTKEKNKNGHPTNSEAEILNQLEDLISARLNEVCVFHYIGRTTLNGSRELLYYLDDPEKANPVMQKLVNDPKPIRQFQYQIGEDKTWDNVKDILNGN